MKLEIDKQISQMLEDDIIEPSKSPWNFPLIVVPKKSNNEERKWRIVVDFRKLNDMTINDVFPLPNISDILDHLGKSKYYSTIDLANGYHQIQLNDSDKEKTAFSTSLGHYHFKRMPFGLKGAPATFQRMMNHIFNGLNGIKCLVYLDDIIVTGHNLNDHNSKLESVFDCFRVNNLKVNLNKCQFLSKEIMYLGHLVTKDGVKPDNTKISVIQNYPQPTNQKQIKSFLGLSGYYRRFINRYSEIAKPLTTLLKKGQPFIWDAFCDQSFSKLKYSLVNPPILQYPDFAEPFNITTDASDIAIGAVLSQTKNDFDLPIAFASRVLNKAELNYPTIEKELLAMVWAVEHFRPYVFGRHFTIITVHKPIIWLCNLKSPSSCVMR